MFLILFRDPRLVPQESSLLKSTMTYSGIQHINMTSTMRRTKISQAFISQQVDSFDESNPDHGEDTLLDKEEDDSSPYSIFQSSFNYPDLKNLPRFFPNQLRGEFPEAAKKLLIEYNKKVKVVNPKQHFNGGNPKPRPTLGEPNPMPQKVHFHENNHSPDNPHPEDSTQAMVHEC